MAAGDEKLHIPGRVAHLPRPIRRRRLISSFPGAPPAVIHKLLLGSLSPLCLLPLSVCCFFIVLSSRYHWALIDACPIVGYKWRPAASTERWDLGCR